jgi:hypothetical protein
MLHDSFVGHLVDESSNDCCVPGSLMSPNSCFDAGALGSGPAPLLHEVVVFHTNQENGHLLAGDEVVRAERGAVGVAAAREPVVGERVDLAGVRARLL